MHTSFASNGYRDQSSVGLKQGPQTGVDKNFTYKFVPWSVSSIQYGAQYCSLQQGKCPAIVVFGHPAVLPPLQSHCPNWILHGPADQRRDSHSAHRPFVSAGRIWPVFACSAIAVDVTFRDTSLQREGGNKFAATSNNSTHD